VSEKRFDVAIAGELNLDLILYGLPEALPRERELLAEKMMLTLGGSSAIVAHNLAALGSRVGFASCIGSDSMGETALAMLTRSGVDVSQVRRDAAEQTGLSVILQGNGSRTILTYAGTIFALKLADLDIEYLSSAKHFHLSSYYLQRGLQRDVPELLRRLKAKGLSISLDCNDDPEDRWDGGIRDALKHVDIFLPNEREAMRITGQTNLENAVTRLAEMVPLVVVKAGTTGAIARRGHETLHSPALKVDAVDAVGAGDSFNAGFLHQYVKGADLATCLRFGNLTGALSVTRAGGTEAFREREHREQFLRERMGKP
jgi:sugar/nucleoside kinase (ribokinase family)